MKKYAQYSSGELDSLIEQLQTQYAQLKARNLKLDMSRGKPGGDQLDLCEGMLHAIEDNDACIYEGVDTRNYGGLDGLKGAKELFAEILGVSADRIIIGGNSSLNLMYDAMARAFTHGVVGSESPWSKQQGLKFLCPAPGYDRHFAITEFFGFELITVPMTESGPDMDKIEKLVGEDEKIKGIWCVPKYSNPDGIIYSDDTIRRLAALRPKAPDFRIFYDNAYVVHHLTADEAVIPDIFALARKYGNENMIFEFASTSKISYPGAGIACIAASLDNIALIKKQIFFQTIGPDKLNQLRHIHYFKNADGVMVHMRRLAAVLRPKFEIVLGSLSEQLEGLGIGSWVTPKGGYFVSFNALEGCAGRIVSLAKQAGVVMTGAGATFPYGKDPRDSNIRIAPTYPDCAELGQAMEVFCLCVKLASAEKLRSEC